ncbi:YhcH/YjgK/YiaL family protein [Clostridium sp. AN503]|uniref:YhcH/YjgK/YiaL family protein n=1 Tax=Clostridium sp. AN503 TaxID=3160598 RepID=UPI003459CBC7
MIFSSIYAKDGFGKYPQAIQTALEYLKANDFTKMEPGVYEIQGRDIYAQVMDAQTGDITEKRPECHEKFVDVQFLASGRERLGFTPDTGDYEVDERFDDRDLIFYKAVEHEGFVEAVPGCYSIFFPADVHRPAIASGEPMKIRKVVVKVSVDLL